MRVKLATLLLVVTSTWIAISPNEARGGIAVFEDTFTGGYDAGWVFSNTTTPGWEHDNGRLLTTNSTGYHWSTSPAFHLANTTLPYTSTFEFEVQNASGSPTGGGHIVSFLALSAPNHPQFGSITGYQFHVGYNNLATLRRYDPGTSLTYVDLVVEQDPKYHLTIGHTYIVTVSNLCGVLRAKVYEKGTPDPGWQLSVADAAYSGGYVGISTWNTTGWMDNVIVEAPGFALDIKPGSCPNPFNTKVFREKNARARKGGVLPAAVVGIPDLAVADIDVTSLLLAGVPPKRHSFDDVSSPSHCADCECSGGGTDGILDLTLKFSSAEIAEAIGPSHGGDQIELRLTGSMLDGTPFEAKDCITIIGNGRENTPTVTETASLGWATPNPFNPRTSISYAIPVATQVRLSIYDVEGRLVTQLVDAYQPSGEYLAEWNAGAAASGIYFYRLEADGVAVTRKMVLLK